MAFGACHEPRMTENRDHLLTILVPTFNRRKNLEELLKVLLPAVRNAPQVQLLVSSNGSSDGTDQILAPLRALPRVQVFEQPINYGMHIHLAWLYGQARGKYLWMLGDDDLIEPDLLPLVVEKLRLNPSWGCLHLPHRFQPVSGEPLLSLKPEVDSQFDRGR